MNVVLLTQEIYTAFKGLPPPFTIRGVAVADGEQVYGICGVMQTQGVSFVICEIKEDVPKRLIILAWRYFKERFMHENTLYYALIDKSLSTAPGFLRHFGFQHLTRDIYIYGGEEWPQ